MSLSLVMISSHFEQTASQWCDFLYIITAPPALCNYVINYVIVYFNKLLSSFVTTR